VNSRANNDAIRPSQNRFGWVAIPLSHFTIANRKIHTWCPDHLFFTNGAAQVLQFIGARAVSNEAKYAAVRSSFLDDLVGVGWMEKVTST
tara:strand:+ start:450 stop:719 length:270 start_codon:yes stop_codon:yes gene_type:complete